MGYKLRVFSKDLVDLDKRMINGKIMIRNVDNKEKLLSFINKGVIDYRKIIIDVV